MDSGTKLVKGTFCHITTYLSPGTWSWKAVVMPTLKGCQLDWKAWKIVLWQGLKFQLAKKLRIKG